MNIYQFCISFSKYPHMYDFLLWVCSKFFPQMMQGRVQFCPSCKWKCSSILILYHKCTHKCIVCKCIVFYKLYFLNEIAKENVTYAKCPCTTHHLFFWQGLSHRRAEKRKDEDMEEWIEYRFKNPSGRWKLTVEYFLWRKIYLKLDFIFWAGWKCNNTPEIMWSKHIKNISSPINFIMFHKDSHPWSLQLYLQIYR